MAASVTEYIALMLASYAFHDWMVAACALMQTPIAIATMTRFIFDHLSKYFRISWHINSHLEVIIQTLSTISNNSPILEV